MSKSRSREHGGSTLLEFVLIGIPLLFVTFSIAEVARGMWSYHTLAYAVREGTRYTIVHGSDCSATGNSCSASIATIAGKIQSVGIGLDQNKLTLTFTPNTGSATTCLLVNCLTNNTVWPPSTANSPGMSVTISGSYPFVSAIAMFWPGGGRSVGAYAAINFPASSKDIIQF